ncbi:MAG: hypothetical protein JW820_04030 [Spirochaetales bacterium]|nr:hypothetical protein [Spirochaetales bacterium]
MKLKKNCNRPALKNSGIIILYVERDVYDFETVHSEFGVLFSCSPCPACQAVGVLGRHACYWKYYYAQRLHVLRCICGNCRVTHAIIPSFSLPGTSIETQEAETYLELLLSRLVGGG